MRPLNLRAIISGCTLLAGMVVHAQGGIRLIIWNYEPVYEERSAGTVVHLGIGYDHDLNDRLSLGVQARTWFENGSWVLTYHSAYHMADNSGSSAYFGPTVGVRHFASGSGPNVFPVGVRLGVRGGLERFFADLHAGVQYNAGAGATTFGEGRNSYQVVPIAYSVGLDLGWGWVRSASRL